MLEVKGQVDHVFTVRSQQLKFDLLQVSLVLLESCLVGAEQAMALLTNGAQNLGSYYCLIRRRFKRRRKKRSERKGNLRSSSSSGMQRVMLSCRLVDLVMFTNWEAALQLNWVHILEYKFKILILSILCHFALLPHYVS